MIAKEFYKVVEDYFNEYMDCPEVEEYYGPDDGSAKKDFLLLIAGLIKSDHTCIMTEQEKRKYAHDFYCSMEGLY